MTELSDYRRMVEKPHLEKLSAVILSQEEQIERLRAALTRIEKWFGEFPPSGRFWRNDDGTESDRPMSYSAAFGSNGERDYMRGVARAALRHGETPQ